MTLIFTVNKDLYKLLVCVWAIIVSLLNCFVAPVNQNVNFIPLLTFVFLHHVLLVNHLVHEVAEAEEHHVSVVVCFNSWLSSFILFILFRKFGSHLLQFIFLLEGCRGQPDITALHARLLSLFIGTDSAHFELNVLWLRVCLGWSWNGQSCALSLFNLLLYLQVLSISSIKHIAKGIENVYDSIVVAILSLVFVLVNKIGRVLDKFHESLLLL